MALTIPERNYINYFKSQLSRIELHHCAYLDIETNTYHLQSNFTDKRTKKETVFELKENFLKDVKNATKKHKYVFSYNYFYDKKILDNVFRQGVSSHLILNAFLIIQTDNPSDSTTFLHNTCEKIIAHNNLPLALECLASKAIHYPEAKSPHYDRTFDSTMNLVKNMLTKFPAEVNSIQKALVKHLKNSECLVSDAHLIDQYKKVFGNNGINLFLKSIGRESINELIMTTTTPDLAICHINFKALCASTLNLYNLKTLSDILRKETPDYPHFYIISQDEESVMLGIEKSSDKALERVKTLLESLTKQDYKLLRDEKNNYEILKNMVLRSNLEHFESHDKAESKHSVFKRKI